VKIELEPQDTEAVVQRVAEILKPMLTGYGKHEERNTVVCGQSTGKDKK
jgi:hypothetical protein